MFSPTSIHIVFIWEIVWHSKRDEGLGAAKFKATAVAFLKSRYLSWSRQYRKKRIPKGGREGTEEGERVDLQAEEGTAADVCMSR